MKTTEEKIKAICPLCKTVSNVPKRLIGNEWGIDDIKCRPCFNERNTFVNLELTKFEQVKRIEQ